jgi:putative transposase
VDLMCAMLEVSRSGYYAWRDRPLAQRQERRAALKAKIRQAFDDSRATYGSPRVTVDLNAGGVAVCENTVAKYMRVRKACR